MPSTVKLIATRIEFEIRGRMMCQSTAQRPAPTSRAASTDCVRDGAEAGEQDQDGDRDVVPDEADHRAPGGEVGAADLRQADRVQEEVDGAVRAEHADQRVGEDDRGHEHREDREALDVGGEAAFGEAQVERDREADRHEEGGADAGGPEGDGEVVEAVAVGEEEGVSLEREVPSAVRRRQPDGAGDRGDDRPDDHPADEEHGRARRGGGPIGHLRCGLPAMSGAGASVTGCGPRSARRCGTSRR